MNKIKGWFIKMWNIISLKDFDEDVGHFENVDWDDVKESVSKIKGSNWRVDEDRELHIFNCEDCEDTGKIIIPAHQAYSEGRGTYIEDEQELVCHCRRKKYEDDMDDDSDDF